MLSFKQLVISAPDTVDSDLLRHHGEDFDLWRRGVDDSRIWIIETHSNFREQLAARNQVIFDRAVYIDVDRQIRRLGVDRISWTSCHQQSRGEAYCHRTSKHERLPPFREDRLPAWPGGQRQAAAFDCTQAVRKGVRPLELG